MLEATLLHLFKLDVLITSVSARPGSTYIQRSGPVKEKLFLEPSASWDCEDEGHSDFPPCLEWNPIHFEFGTRGHRTMFLALKILRAKDYPTAFRREMSITNPVNSSVIAGQGFLCTHIHHSNNLDGI